MNTLACEKIPEYFLWSVFREIIPKAKSLVVWG